jgi:hypothetical protein
VKTFHEDNMRQVQPETLPKNSNFSSWLQNIKLKNNTHELAENDLDIPAMFQE